MGSQTLFCASNSVSSQLRDFRIEHLVYDFSKLSICICLCVQTFGDLVKNTQRIGLDN